MATNSLEVQKRYAVYRPYRSLRLIVLSSTVDAALNVIDPAINGDNWGSGEGGILGTKYVFSSQVCLLE